MTQTTRENWIDVADGFLSQASNVYGRPLRELQDKHIKFIQSLLDQSGDIAPINNKADGKDDRLLISPDWEERFDETFLTFNGGQKAIRGLVKSFIQTELDAAFSEGARKTALLFDQVITPDKIRTEERQRVIEKLKGMTKEVRKGDYDFEPEDTGWNQAIDQAIKEIES